MTATAGRPAIGDPRGEGASAPAVARWLPSARPHRFALVTCMAAAAGAAAVWVPTSPYAIAAVLAMPVLVVAAAVDLAERRLPDELVGTAALPVLVVAMAALALERGVVTAGLLGVAAMCGPLLLAHLVSPASMGFGDVKAAAVLGGAVGLIDPALAMAGLLVALVLAAAVGVAGRLRTLPFGPALVAGTVTVLAAGRFIESLGP